MIKNNQVQIEFAKLNGAGNSFFIVEDIYPEIKARSQLALQLCGQEKFGKTDGLLFVKKIRDLVYQWDFYNSDGSTAEMCGNAARCVTRYLSEKDQIQGQKIEIITLAGSVYGVMRSIDDIDVTMPKVINEGTQDHFQRLNTGVPHLIYPIPTLSDAQKLKQNASHLRKKWNANVTFVVEKKTNHVEAVTFERGVEDFTLACGTGAVAAAVWQIMRNPQIVSCRVQMPGGDLQVIWDQKQEPHLIGSAILEFTNIMTIEVERESI